MFLIRKPMLMLFKILLLLVWIFFLESVKKKSNIYIFRKVNTTEIEVFKISLVFNQSVGKKVKNVLQRHSYCVFTNQRLKLVTTKWCELQHGREIQNNIKLLAVKVLQGN